MARYSLFVLKVPLNTNLPSSFMVHSRSVPETVTDRCWNFN